MCKYRPVDTSDIGIEDRNMVLPSMVFNAPKAQHPDWIRKCSGFNAKPVWYSPSPTTYPQRSAALSLLQWCEDHGDFVPTRLGQRHCRSLLV